MANFNGYDAGNFPLSGIMVQYSELRKTSYFHLTYQWSEEHHHAIFYLDIKWQLLTNRPWHGTSFLAPVRFFPCLICLTTVHWCLFHVRGPQPERGCYRI